MESDTCMYQTVGDNDGGAVCDIDLINISAMFCLSAGRYTWSATNSPLTWNTRLVTWINLLQCHPGDTTFYRGAVANGRTRWFTFRHYGRHMHNVRRWRNSIHTHAHASYWHSTGVDTCTRTHPWTSYTLFITWTHAHQRAMLCYISFMLSRLTIR